MNLREVVGSSFRNPNPKSQAPAPLQFVDLAPVDSADKDGCYTRALKYALDNPRIKNIAITGPYGSGKSSIIRTFIKNSGDKFLNISLASFGEEKQDAIDSILIERSILQQMLYGADANKLPYSRFRRISFPGPGQPIIVSLMLILWILCAFWLYQFRIEIFSDGFSPWSGTGVFDFLLVNYIVAYPALVILDIYKAIFGISFKKISLKNAEIETGDVSENSILNRHLDEIIYFFQMTDYKIVVIEDLDRFGNPEIFVKLREINKLINDNKSGNGQVKFLYALRDGIFAHKDRAKFFDFIIPVVPIIDSSNSLDKMQERVSQGSFEGRIDQQFIREVSLYVDDLRLIHSIFNDFQIYTSKLGSDSLNLTKLLAMMIYKNVYPRDFEQLHYGDGAYYSICLMRSQLLAEINSKINKEIEGFKKALNAAKIETVKSIEELIKLLIGHIISQQGQPVIGFSVNNQLYTFGQVLNIDTLKLIMAQPQIILYGQSAYNSVQTNKSYNQFWSEISPDLSFEQRQANIENSTVEKQTEIKEKINSLEIERLQTSQLPLHLLLQTRGVSIEEVISDNQIESGELLVYLIKNGYLDENYHLFTSNFHEGRLTRNDRDFLLSIRNFNRPDPNKLIDTPKEVCELMRREDFSHNYVLNIYIIDYLFKNNIKYKEQIEDALRFISKNFDESVEFIKTYSLTGEFFQNFISKLALIWPKFSNASVKSDQAPELISYILRFVEANHIVAKMNSDDVLTRFISDQGHLVYASDIHAPERLEVAKRLNVRFKSLALIAKNPELLNFAYQENLYAISFENIKYMILMFSPRPDIEELELETANFTAILASGNTRFQSYINENLSEYIHSVFFALPKNSNETGATVLTLLCSEQLSEADKIAIISKQNHVFETFELVPGYLWSHLLSGRKVVASWSNLIAYKHCEGYDEKIINEFLDQKEVSELLLRSKKALHELVESEKKEICQFLIANTTLSIQNFQTLIKSIPYHYLKFPGGIPVERMEILARERIVRLNEDTFKTAAGEDSLLLSLISKNIDVYINNKDGYPISPNILDRLFFSEIDDKYKIMLMEDMTSANISENKSLAHAIALLIIEKNVDLSAFDSDALSAIILNAQSIENSIEILLKCIPHRDGEFIMSLIEKMAAPYCDIASYGKRPKIPNTPLNSAFATALESKKLVSSIKEEGEIIQINTFKPSENSEKS